MIIGIQRQQTEVGRIRLGVVVKTPGKKDRPGKLDRLRFTSARKALVETIAEAYGGAVRPWQPPKGGCQWEVITDTAEVPVLVPPQDPAEGQWYEMWSAGGCQRRCDGRREKISNEACLCDPQDRACRMHTRLRVMLEEIPGLGAWRVDTGSYYAAVELPGVAELLAMASGAIPARLVLDQRTVTRIVDGESKTFNFAVPTLHVDEITPAQLVSGRVQELIAARRAAAIDTAARAAIAAAAVDYPALVGAARTVEALFDLHRQAKQDSALTDQLLAVFEARAAAIRAAQAAPTIGEPVVIDAEVGQPDEVETVWSQILQSSPWDHAADLERDFCRIVGKPSDEAGVEDMHRYLAAVQSAQPKAAA